MDQAWVHIRRYLKRGLAAVLFSLLVLGATAAALSMVAAGIRALSGSAGPVPGGMPVSAASGSTQGMRAAAGGAGTTGVATSEVGTAAPGMAGGVGVQAPPGASQDTVPAQGPLDGWDHRLDEMQSPIAHTLDRGGVVIGMQVQRTFGQLLSGLLETLFLERPTDASGGQR
ncbi:hypothetical protein [Alicyclobacillus sp.]|uniref:hypothetical protein n=1 Tax=Alicyclobacillus sp. TaxID=61169 RepID=UPI0025BB243A|nr:hypothetical protein [Alicyclobacillus sp.]MCL6515989.1 hypothetical protein [Alicyclobacillus sp.]